MGRRRIRRRISHESCGVCMRRVSLCYSIERIKMLVGLVPDDVRAVIEIAPPVHDGRAPLEMVKKGEHS